MAILKFVLRHPILTLAVLISVYAGLSALVPKPSLSDYGVTGQQLSNLGMTLDGLDILKDKTKPGYFEPMFMVPEGPARMYLGHLEFSALGGHWILKDMKYDCYYLDEKDTKKFTSSLIIDMSKYKGAAPYYTGSVEAPSGITPKS